MQKIETKEFLKRYGGILKKDKISGDNLMICCPFHKENNPSFGLTKNTYFDGKSFYCKWYCFTCHKKGLSLESFISQLNGVTNREALKEAKELMGFDEDSFYLSGKIDKDSLFKINEKEESHFTLEEYMKEFDTTEPHEYMLNRGFNEKTWSKFKFGYSEKRQRIGIPLISEDGKIVSIIGRSIDPKIEPKYLYINKENQNVDKSLYLFNLNNVDFFKDSIILVEGPLNSIAIDQFGETNSVAIMGSKISDEQYEKVMTYFNEITLWLDDDEAGQDGTKDLIFRIKKDNRKISKKIFLMKSKKDAADMTKEEFEETFRNREKVEVLFIEQNKKIKKRNSGKEEDLQEKINKLKKL